jgi:DDE superfamily endonuclease
MIAPDHATKRFETILRERGSHTWHLDEAFVKVNGKLCYLWRAVDHEGEVLEAVTTAKRDKAAALKLLKRIMKKYGTPPTTSRPRLAGTAMEISRFPIKGFCACQGLRRRGPACVLRYRHRLCCLLLDEKHRHPELVLRRSIPRLRPPL